MNDPYVPTADGLTCPVCLRKGSRVFRELSLFYLNVSNKIRFSVSSRTKSRGLTRDRSMGRIELGEKETRSEIFFTHWTTCAEERSCRTALRYTFHSDDWGWSLRSDGRHPHHGWHTLASRFLVTSNTQTADKSVWVPITPHMSWINLLLTLYLDVTILQNLNEGL